MAKKNPVTQRIAGPVDIGGDRFPLSRDTSLMYVQGVHRLVFGDESFFVILYGALNVCGLIATEHNGVAIVWENRGKQILRGHLRDNSYREASQRQRDEYARICSMDEDRFRLFINNHPCAWRKILIPAARPIVTVKLGGLTDGFTATEFSSVQDKVLFFKDLLRFLCNHCDRDRFSRRIYNGLHQHLGHIAHMNANGFYVEWFLTAKLRLKFLEHHVLYPVHGPWHDVGDALSQWIRSPQGKKVVAFYFSQRPPAALIRRKFGLSEERN